MKSVYIASEAMGALVILILLYANIFELKQNTAKRKIFTRLLIANEIVVAADAATWINFGWQERPYVLWFLVAVAFIVPFFTLATFAQYLYAHIAERTKTSETPFKITISGAVAMGVIAFIACVTGGLFEVIDGKYCPGPLLGVYYLIYVISLIFLAGVIISRREKLSRHDLLAALSFCVIPLISIVISMSSLGINLAVPAMALNVLVIYIMLQSERENDLLYKSNNDSLTGLFNRRAYEDDMMAYRDVLPEKDFVYAAIDLNGLKQVNDNLGHAAGDEIILGAANCLRRTFGNQGRIYRTGGDEFVAIIFADEEKLKFLLEDLDTTVAAWRGKAVDSLSLSLGCVTKREFPTETVAEMVEIADKRMYKAKAEYYATKGIDRRGQSEAYKVLCSLYTKILKINITADSFAVVYMEKNEQTEETGYAERISAWLESFGKNGFVHPDDLEDYLAKTNLDYMRDYFRRGKTGLAIRYRRKYDGGFKQVMMEIIPAGDYSDDNQSLFLYVKDIDK